MLPSGNLAEKHKKLTNRGEMFQMLLPPSYPGSSLLQWIGNFFIKKAQKMDLKDKSVAVIGLGDDKYDPDYYIESARILSEFFKEKQANIIISPLKVGRSAVPKLKGKVEKWAKDLSKLI